MKRKKAYKSTPAREAIITNIKIYNKPLLPHIATMQSSRLLLYTHPADRDELKQILTKESKAC